MDGCLTGWPYQRQPIHRPTDAGATYYGPGDVYSFLVTGAETGGAYFAMEAIVPPGGGPPPHIHTHEDETFYVVEGRCEFLLGDPTTSTTSPPATPPPPGATA
jgi:quercetin dioxygenase-like cupin family protein